MFFFGLEEAIKCEESLKMNLDVCKYLHHGRRGLNSVDFRKKTGVYGSTRKTACDLELLKCGMMKFEECLQWNFFLNHGRFFKAKNAFPSSSSLAN